MPLTDNCSNFTWTTVRGWAINNEDYSSREYLYINKGETSEQFILRFIDSLFTEINDCQPARGYKSVEYTIYAHNMGRFDGLFLLKALCSDRKYKINIFSKIIS